MTAPRTWEADVIVNDGAIATLRSIRTDDVPKLREFYARVSNRSKYLRFFGMHPELTDSDIEQWLDTDGYNRVTLVVVERAEIIGVATYRLVTGYLPERVADVSFLVQDSEHGRGIGNILLEHLAEIGREGNIARFTAEMLTKNRQMVQTFVNAGYSVHPQLADGFISVDFTIRSSAASRGVMERRELRAEANSIHRILHPSSVAIIGPTDEVCSVVSSLTAANFSGDARIVTTHGVGTPLARTIDSLGHSADVFVIPQTHDLYAELDDVMAAAARHGAYAVVVLASNISPTITRDQANVLVEKARDHGLRALGPAALGVVNTSEDAQLNLTPAPMPRSGRVGMFTQSAGIAAIMLNQALQHGIGISSFLAAGSFGDVTGNDVMQYWSLDEGTDICLLSLDSIGNPRKFFRVLRRLALVKHVIIFLPSRALLESAVVNAARAVESLPRDQQSRIFDAVIRDTGGMIVSHRETMFNVARLLARQPMPRGSRVAVLSNSSGVVGHMARSAQRYGLKPLPGLIAGELMTTLPERIEQIVADNAVDAVVVTVVEVGGPVLHDAAIVLSQLAYESVDVSLAASFVGFHGGVSEQSLGVLQTPEGAGQLPIFGNYSDALQALALIVQTEQRREAARPTADNEPASGDKAAAAQIVEAIVADAPKGRWARDEECADLLRAYGLDWAVAEDDSDCLVAEEAVSESSRRWVPLTLRCVEDATLGPIVSLAVRERVAEAFGDIAYAAPPVRRSDARRMAESLTSVNIKSAAGRSVVDDLIMRVAALSDDIPALVDIELTVLVADGSSQLAESPHADLQKPAIVSGARMRIAPLGLDRDPQARFLE